LPGAPLQIAGGTGQVQTPLTHGLVGGQLDAPVTFRQLSASRPHIATVVDD
jgi:hypothetical protein